MPGRARRAAGFVMSAAAASPAWVPAAAADPEVARAIAAALDAPLALAQVLVHRGIRDAEAARHFLSPSLDDLHEPLALRDLDRARDRIERAIAARERVLVQGDYDVDGITSTFLLVTTLRALGGLAAPRIPHRTRDGYGLNVAAVDAAARAGVGLIVTVDCGITAVEAVAHARTLGIDVVVTDHHEPGPVLPDAVAVVNPIRPGCDYPFNSLAGVGVTFKLAQALHAARGEADRALEALDLVALGTIADVVPLVGENRILARHGLERLASTARPGLRALIEVAGIGEKRLTDMHVAFFLAPRLNAAGRMGHAEQALRLLFARDAAEARDLALQLENENHKRRRYDEAAAREASERVVHELGWPQRASLVLGAEAWHPGVVGIVASRLVERFQRPALLVALEGEIGRGSGRSTGGIDLTELLAACDDLLLTWGGHAAAAGFTLRRERLPELRDRVEAWVAERLDPARCVPRLVLDGEVALADCTLGLVDWLDRLAPFGLGNPEPLFEVRGAGVESVSRVGDGRHLKLQLAGPSGPVDAIAFGHGDRAASLRRGDRCDLAVVPARNEWMGQTRLQLRVKGIRTP